MSVQSEIARLSGAKSDIAAALAAKGVTVPSGTKLDGMAALIASMAIQRFYTGAAAPDAALGADGDVYLQTGA